MAEVETLRNGFDTQSKGKSKWRIKRRVLKGWGSDYYFSEDTAAKRRYHVVPIIKKNLLECAHCCSKRFFANVMIKNNNNKN